MNIAAADLKRALKKLSPVRTETCQISASGFSAQDSDTLVIETCPFSGLTETYNLHGKKLSQVVNRMSGQIEISQFEKYLELKSAKAKVQLEIQKAKALPLPEPAKHSLTLESAPFKRAISVASASASPAKSAAFGGVVMLQNLPLGLEESVAPGYRVTGTDSITLTTVTVNTPITLQFRSLLNLTAAQIVQLMDGDKIEIGDTDKYLVLRSGSTTVYASKPVQKYPDFDGLLSKPCRIKIGFKPTDWVPALRTVEPMVEEEDKGAVGLHFFDGVLECKSVGVGSTASDETVYEQIDPDPVFDPKDFSLKLKIKDLLGFMSKAGEDCTLGVADQMVKLESEGVVVLSMPVKEQK